MATKRYDNPWAQGINSLSSAYMAREQGLAERAAAQREAEVEAQRWAQEYALDQARTGSQLNRDQSTIGLNDIRGQRIETLLPHEVAQTRAQTFSANASGQSSLANAENTRLESDLQRMANLAADKNMELTGGYSTDIPNRGQSSVLTAQQIAELSQLSETLQTARQEVPEGSPEASEIDRNLQVLNQQMGRNQQVYDMTTDMGTGTLAARRAQAALRAVEEAGGDESVLSPLQRRDLEAYYASQPQTDAGVAALTESQQGKSIQELSGLYNASANLDDAMGQALGIIEQSGDKIVGLPASLTNLTDRVRGAVTGISDLTGIIDTQDAEYLDRITGGITENAADSKTLQALLADVAIMNYRLKNPNDPRMSDFDLKVQLRPLESGSARSIQGYLQSARERIPIFYDNAVQARQASNMEVPEGLRSLRLGQGSEQPSQSGGVQLSPEDEALLDQYLQ